jgi:hypothetical protein
VRGNGMVISSGIAAIAVIAIVRRGFCELLSDRNGRKRRSRIFAEL